MTIGKTIRIYLADGTPSGVRHAELLNWSGQAIVCPRSRLAELSDWAESQRPGVYILVGEDELGTLVYIGEAENVSVRIPVHLKTKDFWTRVVVFTSKDENLTKVHVKYLEARLFELATASKRARIENETKPQRPALPRSDRDAMEDFLGPLTTLLGALGFMFLEAAPTPSSPTISTSTQDPNRLFFRLPKRVIEAQGAWINDEFVVYKDSVADAEVRSSLGAGYKLLRESLIQDQSIVSCGTNAMRFTRNVVFSSPSAAAAVLAGGQYNGREAWKNAQGQSIKTIEEAMTPSSDDKGAG
jgi:Domain of unknown function (DUF4357)